MATFISLITFTDQGIRHVDETTERAGAFSPRNVHLKLGGYQ
jgi:uncharacterized protein with GYD domain